MKETIKIFHNKASREATIDIDGFIGQDWWVDNDKQNTKERLKAELKAIAGIKADTITVNINSYGGDINHGISIHDLLVEHPARVITKINGMTASAATLIALAGDERRMSDNALALIHISSTWAWGNINEFKVAIQDMEAVNERAANMYAKVGNKPAEEYMDIMNENNGRGRWMDADEMLDLGLITDKYEPLKMAAAFNIDFAKYGMSEPPADMLAKIKDQEDDITHSNLTPLWQMIADNIKDFFAPQPTTSDQTNEPTNQQINTNNMDTPIMYTQEQLDESLAAQRIEIEQSYGAQIISLQASIDDLQIQLTAPAAEPSQGPTADIPPAVENTYMDLDIHARVIEMQSKRKTK